MSETSWVLLAAGVWFFFIRKKPGTGTTIAQTMSGAGAPFGLTSGLNNGGDLVQAGSQIAVQAWPGAYSTDVNLTGVKGVLS